MNKEEIKKVIDYIQHHLLKIIQYEDGSWCNCDIKLDENGIINTLIIKPCYRTLFDNK